MRSATCSWHGPAGSLARALRRAARRRAAHAPAAASRSRWPRCSRSSIAALLFASTPRRRLAAAERPGRLSAPAPTATDAADGCACARGSSRPGPPIALRVASSRPRGSPRAARSSTSRAARVAPRRPPRSRSTRCSRRSASSATSCSSTSAARAARRRSPARRSTCGRRMPRAVASYLRRCFARLGGRARRFTTATAAADLERVRRRSAMAAIDVYGSSYGATLAQLYLRRFPRSVRTATLDGASLPSMPVYELAARNAERALRVQIARCRAQLGLPRGHFPTRGPSSRACWRGTRARPTPSRRRSPSCCARPRTPRACRCSCTRRPRATPRRWLGSSPRTWARSSTRARAFAMFWIILCNERWARFDVAATGRASRGSYLSHAARGARAALPAGLRGGAPPAARPRSAQPWSSPVPVLLLAGDGDPQDPPGNLRRLARDCSPTAGSSRVPGLAHGVIAYGCLRLVVARFVAPRRRPRAGRELRAASCRCRASSSASRVRGARRARERGALRGRAGIPSAASAPSTPTAAATKSAARTPSTTASGDA